MLNKVFLFIFCALVLSQVQGGFFNLFTRPQEKISDLDLKILQIEPLQTIILEFLNTNDLAKLCEVSQSFNKDYRLTLWSRVTTDMLALEDQAIMHHEALLIHLDHIHSFQDFTFYQNRLRSSICMRGAAIASFVPYLVNLSMKLEYSALLLKLKLKYSDAETKFERDFIDKTRKIYMTELLIGNDIDTVIANCAAQMNQVTGALDSNPAILESSQCTKVVYLAPWRICIETYMHLKKIPFFLDLLERRLDKNQPSFLVRVLKNLFSSAI